MAADADAAPAVVYASPDGSGTACSPASPCSLTAAAARVRAVNSSAGVTVQLSDGTYRLAAPLQLRAEDGGRDGGTVRWTAAPGARPVLTGALPVTGWRVHDAAQGVYVADTPQGLDSRQLVVEGVLAPRAAIRLAASDIAVTAQGIQLRNQNLAYLASLPQQNRIELESLGDFTDRYMPVSSISTSMITLAQPAWDNNTWGYDTTQYSFLAAPTFFLANSLRFLTTPGQWFVDPGAGKLYYKPGPGVDPNTLDVELPRLQTLMSVGGTYDSPVTNLRVEGLTFTGTSWLGPSSPDGYAVQQNGAFLKGVYSYRPADAFTSCRRGCTAFERARTQWWQEPAAVQVSAAGGISFAGNTFTGLGSTGLGIGQDANAHSSGVGLGASSVAVTGNVFTELAGHGVAVGGVRPDAHHPSDPRMTNRDIRIEDNTVNHVAVDYKDNSGILSTYVDGLRIVRNEVANVPYDAIDTGYGWGMNDPGGSNEYNNRGYYTYNTRYSTPTTLRDNLVANNLVHHTKAKFADGGSVYNLSASPGTVIEKNYLYSVSGVGLYLDEGTRYTTYRNNVLQGASPWVFTNSYGTAHNTNDNTISGNWFNAGGASTPDAGLHNNRITDNVQVSGTAWPSGARDVICQAGVTPSLRTQLNANVITADGACGDPGAPVAAPLTATASSAAGSFLAQSGSRFALSADGADVWGAGGQRDDQFGAIYRRAGVSAGTVVSARVDSVNDANPYAKTGVMIRNDMTRPGSSPGYAIVAVTPRNGVLFEWDADGDGYLDGDARAAVDTYRAVWVRLARGTGGASSQFAASYSFDGVTWVPVGSAVMLPGAASTQDGGIFSSSHDRSQRAVNIVSDVRVGGPVVTPTPTTSSPVPTTFSPVPTTSSPRPTTSKPKPTGKVRCRTNSRGKKTCRTVPPKTRKAASPASAVSIPLSLLPTGRI
ncbi:MAG: right-handed parallel beta-helix repeat-containing protein [Kineosporiaceae bacterium]